MRRFALAALVAVLLGSAASAQTRSGVTHRSGPLAVTLPASFQGSTSTPMQEVDGVRSNIAVFTDMTTQRLVAVNTFSGLSLWQRFKFKRGIGFSGSSNFSYDRVSLNSLPLSDSFAGVAGVAYTGVDDGGGMVGLLVRGCDEDMCYEVAAQGPAMGRQTRGVEYAGLLSGVSVTR